MKYTVEYLLKVGYYHHHSSYDTLEEAKKVCNMLNSKTRIIIVVQY